MKKIIVCLFLFALCACGGGFDAVNNEFMSDFADGNYNVAAEKIADKTVNPDKGLDNAYLGGLQCGTGFLWANNSVDRNACFDNSDAVLAGALDEGSGYKIKDYEKIMLKTYTAIGELSDGDEHANQSFRQAYSLQQRTVDDNDSEIADAKEKFHEEAQTLTGLPDMNSIVNSISDEMAAQSDVAVMKDYVNPYTTYLTAIYDGVNGDRSNAENYLNRVRSFAPENEFIKTDANVIKNKKSSVWVFFENGIIGPVQKRSLAPQILQDFDIELTIPDVYPGTPAWPDLWISANGRDVRTEFLANMDSVLKTDMEKYKTGNIIKSVSFEVGKLAAATTAGIVAGKAVGKQSDDVLGAYAGVLIGMAIMSVEKPWDLRSWTSLPTEVQSARIDMPADRRLVLNGDIVVEIPNDIKNAVVFVRVPTMHSVPGIVIGKLN